MQSRSKCCIFFLILTLTFPCLLSASIQIGFSFSPTLSGGTDPHGLADATWDFEFNVSQTIYSGPSTARVLADSVFLTLNGSLDVDGRYELTELDTGDFYLHPSELFDIATIGSDGTETRFDFQVGDITVSDFFVGSPMALKELYPDDPVSASDWNGLIVSTPPTFNFTAGTAVFTVPETVVVASTVPEPEFIGAIFGIFALIFTGIARARSKCNGK